MNVAPELETHLRPIGTLIPLPDNARQGDVGAISQSLERFGQLKPIVVDSDGVILAGNHTYAAAVALGWTEIAVVESSLEGQEKSAFALADNRLSDLATYDNTLLLDALQSLDNLVGTGYDDGDIDQIKYDLEHPLAYDDEPASEDGDERYTPAWLFEAMDATFDIDLAAPLGGIPYIPADRYFTKDDDALSQDWTGLFAWCNPPYSVASKFGEKWLAETTEGVWLGPISHSTRYRVGLMRACSHIWIPHELEFTYRGVSEGIAFPVFAAGFGERGEEAITKLGASDRGILFNRA